MPAAHVYNVASRRIEAREVDVQVHIAHGNPYFGVVGLADKAVGESRERVGAALSAIGLALPPERIIVNLAPADLPKEAATTIFRSRSRSSPRWRPAAREMAAIRRWANSRSTPR